MSRLGTFSLKAYPTTWFNDLANPGGWLPQDVVPLVGATPPPPPPPPKPVATRVRSRPGGGGGGSGVIAPYCVPDWLKPYYPAYFPLVDEPPTDGEAEIEAESDFALLYLPDGSKGAKVRALAAGTVERIVDGKGRVALVLEADDGTRYWYADLGRVDVVDGARIEAGQVIARTKPGAPPIPTVTTRPAAPPAPVGTAAGPAAAPLPALSAGTPTAPIGSPRPAQVVFVESPPATEPAASARLEPAPSPPEPRAARAPLVMWKLMPQQPEDRAPAEPLAPPHNGSLREFVSLGLLVAALLYAATLFDRRRSPPRPIPRVAPAAHLSKRKPRKKRRVSPPGRRRG